MPAAIAALELRTLDLQTASTDARGFKVLGTTCTDLRKSTECTLTNGSYRPE